MDAAGVIAALLGSGGALTVLGAAGKFVWGKVDKRVSALEGEVNQCREHHGECREEVAGLKATQMRNGVLLRLLGDEFEAVDRDNIVLRRVQKELAEHYPFDASVPAEMRAFLAQLKKVPW